MNVSALCECGCGQPAPISKYTRRKHGYKKGEPQRFVLGHNRRGLPGRFYPGRQVGRRVVREHRLIVESVLGKPLPRGAEVHHVNGNKRDNRNQNLVACQDRAYHKLLHVRQRALWERGHSVRAHV